MSQIPKRVIFGVILVLSVYFAPFWLTAILVFLGMILFNFYIEGVVAMLFSDLFFGVGEMRFFNILFFSTIISLFSLLFIEMLKKKLKFYTN